MTYRIVFRTPSPECIYADDTYLTLAGDNIELNLNKDLASVSEWLIAKKLTLNKSKDWIHVSWFSGKTDVVRPFSLSKNWRSPDKPGATWSLGIDINENLTWNLHIENLSKTITSGIGALKRIRPFVPHRTLRFIYNSLVKPHFDYCNVVWGNCNKTLANKLQKLQNRAARVLTAAAFDTSTEYLFQVLNKRRRESQRQIQKACMVYKCLNGFAPDYLRSRFVERSLLNLL